MHLSKPLLLTLGILAGADALAGEDPFTGFRAGLGLSAGVGRHQIYTTPAYRMGVYMASADTIWSAHGTRQGFLTPTADLSYGFPLSERWIGTIGFRADLATVDAGDIQLAKVGNREDKASMKLKRHVALYFQPGYRLSDNWQLYGSLGYHQARAEYGSTVSGKHKHTLNGFGLGFGAERAFNKQLSLRMEVQSVPFSNYSVAYSGVKAYDAEYGQARGNVLLTYRF
ncbi:outer membrane protein [Paludibacterium purpuratum]|uniref:Outer membrane protein with beta-barrel domain n=1 Tax=Paludibacterium purpuratum TaxID=1144873 RepID=A0A4R7B0T6_9NEIS|nr:outer membrane beta-barrel protein [Paludibacterium purpuratum]TDR76546.1 outer membrane protein with beta-barrel domain [Paludibacterium purpuratum]